MSRPKKLRLVLEDISEDQIVALAKFTKRATKEVLKDHTTNDKDAQDLEAAFHSLRQALILEGYNPR